MIERIAFCGRAKTMVDFRQLAHEAAQRERRAWLYVFFAAGMILVLTFGFIWLTW